MRTELRHIDLHIKHRLELGESRTTINREMQALGQAFRLTAKKKLADRVLYFHELTERRRQWNLDYKANMR